MVEAMAQSLRAFCGSQWTVAGDREKFAYAWHRWVEGQFLMEGMMHLPPPPSVPPIQPAAPAFTVVKAVPKAAPKPPLKTGLSVPYGSYSDIRVVPHQRGVSDVNVCPWYRLDGAGQCPWRASRHLKPSHLNPRDLLDHLARHHGSNPAQHDQVESMIMRIMPGGRTGPFAAAKAGTSTLAQPSEVQSSGAKEASSSVAFSVARGSMAVSSIGGTGAARSGSHTAFPSAAWGMPGGDLLQRCASGLGIGLCQGNVAPAAGAGATGPPPPGGPNQADACGRPSLWTTRLSHRPPVPVWARLFCTRNVQPSQVLTKAKAPRFRTVRDGLELRDALPASRIPFEDACEPPQTALHPAPGWVQSLRPRDAVTGSRL